MEKTALQIAIEQIGTHLSNDGENTSVDGNAFNEALIISKRILQSLFPIEREQIVDAANAHRNLLISNDIECEIHETDISYGQQYFTSKYKQ
jgi:hypothetical protein